MLSESFADSMPAYGDVLAGRDGRLWVQDPYRMRRYPLTWTAYEEGVPVARAELPPRFFPFEFGRDWVMGITYDELRVERVRLIELVEGELPGLELTPREGQAPTNMPRCGPWAGR